MYLLLSFLKLFETYPDVGDKVLCSPIESLPACNKEIIKAQQRIIESLEYKETISKLDYCHLKRNAYARFFGLPVCPELHRTVFPKNVDLGCFLKVTGECLLFNSLFLYTTVIIWIDLVLMFTYNTSLPDRY